MLPLLLAILNALEITFSIPIVFNSSVVKKVTPASFKLLISSSLLTSSDLYPTITVFLGS